MAEIALTRAVVSRGKAGRATAATPEQSRFLRVPETNPEVRRGGPSTIPVVRRGGRRHCIMPARASADRDVTPERLLNARTAPTFASLNTRSEDPGRRFRGDD